MNPHTRIILLHAAEADPTLGPSFLAALRALVARPDIPPAPDLVTEPEAARILGLGQSTLNQWRRDPSRPFPFRTYPQPQPESPSLKTPKYLYDRRELVAHLHATAIPPRPG